MRHCIGLVQLKLQRIFACEDYMYIVHFNDGRCILKYFAIYSQILITEDLRFSRCLCQLWLPCLFFGLFISSLQTGGDYSMHCCDSGSYVLHSRPKIFLQMIMILLSHGMVTIKQATVLAIHFAKLSSCRKWFLLPNPGICLPLVGLGNQKKSYYNWNF